MLSSDPEDETSKRGKSESVALMQFVIYCTFGFNPEPPKTTVWEDGERATQSDEDSERQIKRSSPLSDSRVVNHRGV